MQDIKAVDILPLLQEKIAIVSGKLDSMIGLILSKFINKVRTVHVWSNNCLSILILISLNVISDIADWIWINNIYW